MTRTDTAARVIKAAPHIIYEALLDPRALISWLPPKGMTGRIHVFEPHDGGRFRIELTYNAPVHDVAGKTGEHTDVVNGRFVSLVPHQHIIQVVEFDSGDPAFAGAMTMTWTFDPVQGGTEVRIRCENVPAGIRKADHDAGLASTLGNLAAYTEECAALRQS